MYLYLAYITLILAIFLGLFLTNRHGAKLRLNQLNFATWYYGVEFLLMAVISAFLIRRISDTNWALKYIPPEEFPIIAVTLTCAWCCVAIPLGFYLANKFLHLINKESNFESLQSQQLYSNQIFKIINGILLIIEVIFLAYLIYKIGFIPQIEALKNPENIMQIRGTLTHNFPANVYLKEILTGYLSYLVLFSSITIWYLNKSTVNTLVMLIALLASILFATLTLTKASLAFVILGIIFTFALIIKELKTKFVLVSAGIVIVSLSATFVLANNISFLTSLRSIYHRVVYTQSYGNYLSFYIYPDKREHIGLSSTSRLIKKLGFDYRERSSREIMKDIAPNEVAKGTAGYAVSAFFAEAWANFGLLGIIISPIYVGFFIKFLIGFILNFGRNPLTISTVSFLSYKLGVNQGFNQFLFPRYLILTLCLILGLYLCLTKSKIFKKNTL